MPFCCVVRGHASLAFRGNCRVRYVLNMGYNLLTVVDAAYFLSDYVTPCAFQEIKRHTFRRQRLFADRKF
jgi:hypothetical protein